MVNEFELGILKNFGTVISLPHPFPSFDTIQLSTCMRFSTQVTVKTVGFL